MITRDYVRLRSLSAVRPFPYPFLHAQCIGLGASQEGLSGTTATTAYPAAQTQQAGVLDTRGAIVHALYTALYDNDYPHSDGHDRPPK